MSREDLEKELERYRRMWKLAGNSSFVRNLILEKVRKLRAKKHQIKKH